MSDDQKREQIAAVLSFARCQCWHPSENPEAIIEHVATELEKLKSVWETEHP